MTIIRTCMAAVVATSFGAACPAQVSPATTEISDAVKENVRRRIERGSSVGIVVGLVNANGTTFFSAGSVTKGGDAVTESTIFEIGSITKVFTSLLLADAVETGSLKLDDAIDGLVPDGVSVPSLDGGKITLLDLATHHSGLPRLPSNITPANESNPYVDYTDKMLHAFLSSHKLSRKPGSAYEYSNLGAGLLGHLLARRAGKPLAQLLRDRICKPLGLSDTTLKRSAAPTSRLAQGHHGNDPTDPWDFDCLAGCGALRSTAKDMLTFLAAHVQIQSSPLSAAMIRMQSPRRDTNDGNLQIALGWHVSTKNEANIFWHNGETGGFHSFIGFHADRKIGVVVLTNSNSDIDDIGLNLLDRSFPLKMPILRIKLTPEQLRPYVGKYAITGNKIFSVTAANDHLRMRFGSDSVFDIFPESKTEFRYEIMDATVTFSIDDTGRVTRLVLGRGDTEVVAKRLH